MGRKKLTMKKIENSTSRLVTYSKRKDVIIKKANELSVLCDTDVGLVMFSPSGRLTSFASKGRVEDIFLRYLDQPDELRGGSTGNEEYLYRFLTHLKYEGEMLEKIAKLEALEEQLCTINQQQQAALEKIRFYNPDPEKITSVHEAQLHKQYLIDAIQHIEQLKNAKIFGHQTAPGKPESIEFHEGGGVFAVDINDGDRTTEGPVNSVRKRILSGDGYQHEESRFHIGQHPSFNYLQAQESLWNLPGSGKGMPL